MRTKRPNKTTRLNLETSVKDRKLLERLRVKTGAYSLTEVISRALAAYDFVQHSKALGRTIVSRDFDGKERELIIL